MSSLHEEHTHLFSYNTSITSPLHDLHYCIELKRLYTAVHYPIRERTKAIDIATGDSSFCIVLSQTFGWLCLCCYDGYCSHTSV